MICILFQCLPARMVVNAIQILANSFVNVYQEVVMSEQLVRSLCVEQERV